MDNNRIRGHIFIGNKNEFINALIHSGNIENMSMKETTGGSYDINLKISDPDIFLKCIIPYVRGKLELLTDNGIKSRFEYIEGERYETKPYVIWPDKDTTSSIAKMMYDNNLGITDIKKALEKNLEEPFVSDEETVDEIEIDV